MIWLQVALAASSHAAYSSIYIFGDSVSSTSSNSVTGPNANLFYGKRFSNGRVWVEVLAQRLGLGANSVTNANWSYASNNISGFGLWSSLLITVANNHVPPPNATNCLYLVWVCNADFVGDVGNYFPGPNLGPNNGTNLADWTAAINQHLTNHFRAITNLYAKGCRTLVAPNAVDIMAVPQYNGGSTPAYRAFVRQRISSFNTNYAAMLKQIASNSPGLKIISPDIFGLLDNVMTNAASYGLTNATFGGATISATGGYLPGVATNGPGTNFIFWGDSGDPSAKFHAVIADVTLQMLSPVGADMDKDPITGANQLKILNAPIGMNGQVLYASGLDSPNWLTNSTFTTTANNQTLSLSSTNAMRFYRLKFPWQWSWP